MAKVPIEMVQEGWKVIAEVRDPSGRVLMNSGTTITLRQKESLIQYGVLVIDVQESDAAGDVTANAGDEERFQTAARTLEPLFVHADRSWDVVAAIHTAAVRMQMDRSPAEGSAQ